MICSGVGMCGRLASAPGIVSCVAPAEDHRALHPSRAGADHEHVVLRVRGGLEALRVPTAAVFLARGRVLRADQRRPADLPARDADVAADALADVVEPPLVDLLW